MLTRLDAKKNPKPSINTGAFENRSASTPTGKPIATVPTFSAA